MAMMRHVGTWLDLALEDIMDDARQETSDFSPETAFSPTGGKGQPDTNASMVEPYRPTVPAPETTGSPESPEPPEAESNDR